MGSMEWKLVAMGILVAGAGCSAPKSAEQLVAAPRNSAERVAVNDSRSLTNDERLARVAELKLAGVAARARGDRSAARACAVEGTELLIWTRPARESFYTGMFFDFSYMADWAGDKATATRARENGYAVSGYGWRGATRRDQWAQFEAIAAAARRDPPHVSGEGSTRSASPAQRAAAAQRAINGDTSHAAEDAETFQDELDSFASSDGLPNTDPRVLNARTWLAQLYIAQRDHAAARRELERIWAALLGFAPDHPVVIDARKAMVSALRGLGDDAAADAFEKGSVKPGEPWVVPSSSGGASSTSTTTEEGSGVADSGAPNAERGGVLGGESPTSSVGGGAHVSGDVAPTVGATGNARATTDSTSSTRASTGPATDLSTAESQAANGDHDAAIRAFDAVLVAGAGGGFTSSDLARANQGKARSQRALGDLAGAYATQKRVVELPTENLTASQSTTNSAREFLTQIANELIAFHAKQAGELQRKCELEAAAAERAKIVEILREAGRLDGAAIAEALREQAALLRVLARTEEARRLEQQVQEAESAK